MNFSRVRHFCSAVLILALLLGLAAPAPARDLTPREEAALFSYTDLGKVDLSPKQVELEVYVSPSPELAACRRMIAQVQEQVQQFYARLGVYLVYVPAGPTPGPLAPTQRLRVELLSDKEWLDKSFKAFEVAPPLRLRFLQVCRDKCAYSHVPLSVTHISFKRFEQAQLSADPKDDSLNRNWLANLLIHELGHLLGLYHAHEFVNDPIPVRLPDKTPNFMSQKIAFKKTMGFVEFQRLLIHSYLGHGKVYQQYQAVGFDPLRYLELVKLHNGYREPLSQMAKMAQRVKKGSPKTFDDDDDDDDDD
ncbi:MAG: hypothetical protein NTY36_11320 [Deltaproteobacteria bacterium]|nr:hypothetical protein [Deltaproteobacteria bacterium]